MKLRVLVCLNSMEVPESIFNAHFQHRKPKHLPGDPPIGVFTGSQKFPSDWFWDRGFDCYLRGNYTLVGAASSPANVNGKLQQNLKLVDGVRQQVIIQPPCDDNGRYTVTNADDSTTTGICVGTYFFIRQNYTVETRTTTTTPNTYLPHPPIAENIGECNTTLFTNCSKMTGPTQTNARGDIVTQDWPRSGVPG
jgi:hypothetical protein